MDGNDRKVPGYLFLLLHSFFEGVVMFFKIPVIPTEMAAIPTHFTILLKVSSEFRFISFCGNINI